MARKVFISSDMSIDERLIEVAEENPTAALLWPWILTSFDDWGRAEANPKRLKAKVFPMIETVTFETISEALQLYAKAGLIILYQVDGKEYMAIPQEKWFAYQTHIRSSKRENDGSRYPAPPSDDAHDSAQVRADARKCTPSPSPSLSLSKKHACKQTCNETEELEGTAEEPEFTADQVAVAKEELGIGTEESAIDPRTSVVVAACELAFGRRLGPLQEQKLLAYLDDGIEVEAIEYALRKAGEAGKDFKYADGILSSWLQKGIRTLEAAKREADEFRRRMTRAGPRVTQGGDKHGRDRPSDRERLEQEYAFWNELSL